MVDCPECSMENPDGAVFCNSCGERIVISFSDTDYGECASGLEEPYLEVQAFGQTTSYTKDGFMLHIVPATLIMLAFSAFLIIGGLTGAMLDVAIYIGLFFLSLVSLLNLLNFMTVRRYREKGRPLDFGGNDMLPTAASIMDIEDDSNDAQPGAPARSESLSKSDRIIGRR